jgi:3-oxoacyl-[acyl-carrier protein] reductase
LEETARAIRAGASVTVQAVAGDIAREETRFALLAACRQPDIVVNNNGGPPPGAFKSWDRDAWIAAFDANMIAATLLIRATIEGMVKRRFGRAVNITSAMVKTPLSPMGLSTTARSALTWLCRAKTQSTPRRAVGARKMFFVSRKTSLEA